MIVNVDFIEDVLNTNKPIEVAHDLSATTTYEPSRIGVLIKRNGKIVGVVDRERLLLRYADYPPSLETVYSKATLDITKKTFEFKGFKILLKLSSYSYMVVPEFNDYKRMIELTGDPLLSAYIISMNQSTSRETFYIPIPAVAIIDSETLFKCSLVSYATGVISLKFVDVLKILKIPMPKLVNILRRQIVKVCIPFHSNPPIYYAHDGFEFYSMNHNYVLKRKNGKIEKTFCGDVETFCELVKVKFEGVVRCLG